MKRRSELYLQDIMDAIGVIERVVSRISREQLDTDIVIFDALVLELYKIGEAATQLPGELKAAHPEVEWRSIQGFRNLVAHRYWSLNRDRVWEIVQNKLAPLRVRIAAMLEEEKAA